MKKIYLYIFDLCLGEFKEDSSLNFFEDEKMVIKAKKLYPLNMRLYKTNENGIIYPIEEFIEAVLSREDIIEVAGINLEDSMFEKLYKLSNIEIQSNNGFYLKRA